MKHTSPGGSGNITYTPSDLNQITESDARVLKRIKRIIANGNNAEVKRRKDGSVAVYEVRKSIVEI